MLRRISEIWCGLAERVSSPNRWLTSNAKRRPSAGERPGTCNVIESMDSRCMVSSFEASQKWESFAKSPPERLQVARQSLFASLARAAGTLRAPPKIE
jgi:hypothetical protein